MAFAFFSKMTNVDIGFIQSVDEPCLIMSNFDSLSWILKMSIVNPDLGIKSRSFAPLQKQNIEITLEGELELIEDSDDDVNIILSSKEMSKIVYLLNDGLPQIGSFQKNSHK